MTADMEQAPAPDARETNIVLTVVACGVAALVAGVIWGGIVTLTGYEIGYAAIGVGFVAGLGVTLTTPERTAALGAVAAGAAVFALIIGKLLIVQWGAAPRIAEEMKKDAEFVNNLYMGAAIGEMEQEGDIDAETMAQFEALEFDEEPTGELAEERDRILRDAQARVDAMSEERKEEIVDETAEEVLSSISYGERISATAGFFDIIWAVFAVAVAWGMATKTD